MAHWLGHSLAEALRLGADADDLRMLAAVASSLRQKAVVGLESDGATTPPPAG
ncbi:MAG: hypothetical protein KA387_06370 [Rubrivivax sp.]|nr:hypothetical protein [Rubrivivax sp.]